VKLPPGTFAIALSCADEAELRVLAKRFQEAGIHCHHINEPDEPYNGQLMAIGLPPAYKSSYRRYLSNLPLIK